MRHVIACIALAAVLASITAGPARAQSDTPLKVADMPSLLHEYVLVSERVLRLGDLFTNAGEKAEIAVAYAPEPGKRQVLDARWLFRVASAYGLQWRPSDGAVQAVVERDAIAVPPEVLKDEILLALSGRGISADMDLEFAHNFRQIFLPATDDPVLRVDTVDYRERTGRFSAVLTIGAGADIQQVRLTGRVFKTVDVPVLNARVGRGQVIKAHHVQWIRSKSDRIQADVVMDDADLIGMTPKRTIRTGTPIRAADITRPQVVQRNGLVTIHHQFLNMTLTAQGRALQSGAMGDVVQIKNAQSNLIIEAEIIGPGRVAVRVAQPQLSMNLN